MNKTLKLILIIVGVVLVLFVIMRACNGGDKSTEVSIEQVVLRDISETVSANGKIQPEVDVKITSQVSGQIVDLPVKEGDVVQKGDLLLQVNPDIYEAAYNRASASVNNARSNLASSRAQLAQINARFKAAELTYNRNKALFEQGAISTSDWENAEASYEVSMAEVTSGNESIKAAEFSITSANASLKEASDNLSRTTILAPKSGTITALTKELGESVLGNNMMAGEVIMNVSDLETMEVDVEVNESDIVRVKLGDHVDIEVDAFLDQTFSGVVTEIGNTAINASGISLDAVTNFSVKVRILEDSYTSLQTDSIKISPFRPGMSANVEIQTESLSQAVCVPIKAVTLRSDTTSSSSSSGRSFGPPKMGEEKSEEKFECVLVVNKEDNSVRLVPIQTGIQDIEYIQVIEGINENQWVIVSPYSAVKRLKTGSEFQLKESSTDKDE